MPAMMGGPAAPAYENQYQGEGKRKPKQKPAAKPKPKRTKFKKLSKRASSIIG